MDEADWFRATLTALGLTQSALARLMVECGDHRSFKDVLRTVNRLATGGCRMSGEMAVILALLAERQGVSLPIRPTMAARRSPAMA